MHRGRQWNGSRRQQEQEKRSTTLRWRAHVPDPAQIVVRGAGPMAVDTAVRLDLCHIPIQADTMAVDLVIVQVHLT